MFIPVFALVVFTRVVSVLAFSESASNNIAVYWGQNSAGSQQPLSTYCESDTVDIVLLSFLYQYPEMQLNFANACEKTYTSEGLLHCSNIAADIKTCQNNGKKVLLSLGGALGAYGFTSDDEATQFADKLWDYFGAGSGVKERPFDDAIVDGFDFDVENMNQVGYPALAKALREKFATDSSRKYYLSAAPQCPYPDMSVGDLMSQVELDFAFIQFYNNYCMLGSSFNWDTWADYAANTSPNKNIKMYVGLPGLPLSAGTGYLSAADVQAKLPLSVLSDPNFGGFSFWDASSVFGNVEGDKNIAQTLKAFAAGGSGSGGGLPQLSVAQPSSVAATSLSTSTSLVAPISLTTPTTLYVVTSSLVFDLSLESVLTVSSISTNLQGGGKEIELPSATTSQAVEESTESTEPTEESTQVAQDSTQEVVEESPTEVATTSNEPSVEPTTEASTEPTTEQQSSELPQATPESGSSDSPINTSKAPTTLVTQSSLVTIVDAFEQINEGGIATVGSPAIETTTSTQADGQVVVVTRDKTTLQVVTATGPQTTRVKKLTVTQQRTNTQSFKLTDLTTRYVTTIYNAGN